MLTPLGGPDVLVAEISGEEVIETDRLLYAAVHGPEEGRVEAIRELMRYTREVLGISEPEAPC